jgi:hypothetical protein
MTLARSQTIPDPYSSPLLFAKVRRVLNELVIEDQILINHLSAISIDLEVPSLLVKMYLLLSLLSLMISQCTTRLVC